MSATDTGWHADEQLLDRYLGDSLDLAQAASLEAHLLRCDSCRRLLSGRVPPRLQARVDQAWVGIRTQVQLPPLPVPVRVLRRLGLRDDTAVLLAAARSLSTAWTLATVVVLVFAALAVLTETNAGRAVYLIVAPLIPVAGVVAAFGSVDPLGDLTRTTPYPPARLVLLRAGGVSVFSVPLAVGVGLLVPGTLWLAFAWLAPAIALILLVLCASTWVDPLVAGGVVALGWAALVGQALRAGSPVAAVEGLAQAAYLVLAVVAAVVLVLRIRRSNIPGGAL
ncbi:MAG TPA: zf-HC2 domain-containing protein [Propionibacteriaceae bacterium]|jgi:hypothetical protein